MKRISIPPCDEELILANRVVWKARVLIPGYIKYTAEAGIEIFPFERELPSASFVAGTIFVLDEQTDYEPLASLDFKSACEYISSRNGWYENAALSVTDKTAERRQAPLLLLKG
jgi:hypothetical protein